MKKLLFTSFIVGLFGSCLAQEPEMKSRSLAIKFTETWCGPCGASSFVTDDILEDIGDKGYFMAVMGSSSPFSMNSNCYDVFESNYPLSGLPSFFANDMDLGWMTTTIAGQTKDIYDAFYETAPIVSPAGTFTFTETKITVDAKAKFWTDATGEYYLAAFIVEDSVIAKQNGKSDSVHRYIMRGTMMADYSPWGQLLSGENIAANTEFTKSFERVLHPSWNLSKLSVLLVVYKKEGSKYKFINTMKTVNGNTMSLNNNNSLLSNVSVYPNPTHSFNSQLEISLVQPKELNVKIVDISGKVIYSIPNTFYPSGKSFIELPCSAWMNGTYYVHIQGEQINNTSSIVVNH